MRIAFDVGDAKAVFTRNWFTGHTRLHLDGLALTVEDPADVGTHFTFALTRAWRWKIQGRQVVVEKSRPRWMAGFRPQTYRIAIDGQQIVEKTGY